MTYVPTQAGRRFAEAALTKLIIYFKDGNARTFYGRPTAQRFTPVDPRALEILRLKKYADREQSNIHIAILYDTRTGDELARFKNGAWV